MATVEELIKKIIMPKTEGHYESILMQYLIFLGNIVGKGTFFRIENSKQYLNNNVVIVGKSSKARKGTSYGQVENIIKLVDLNYFENNIISGLSSGEGLISLIQDTIPGPQTADNQYQTLKKDKRLLVVESEFANILKQIKRETNILSPVLRDAWDCRTLRNTTKNFPQIAKDPHISIIGHITERELTRLLNPTEVSNGFANRFIWIHSKRTKCIPIPKTIPNSEIFPLINLTNEALKFGQKCGEITFSIEGSHYWTSLYEDLSEEKEGIIDALTGRSEAHILRLACLYCLLDKTNKIEPSHLNAAKRLWAYSEESLLKIFSGSEKTNVDHNKCKKILGLLLYNFPNGTSKTQIRDLFNRNLSGEKTDQLLRFLDNKMEIIHMTLSTHTGGKPTELWHIRQDDITTKLWQKFLLS